MDERLKLRRPQPCSSPTYLTSKYAVSWYRLPEAFIKPVVLPCVVGANPAGIMAKMDALVKLGEENDILTS